MGPSFVVLAAGLATRFGRLKQFEPVGPDGAALMDYGIYEARRAGFEEIVVIVAPGMEPDFTAHFEQVFAGRLRPTLVAQRRDDLPPTVRLPPERVKPWGTAHAVLAVRTALHHPFAVSNADDYYGPSSYALLAAHLRGVDPAAPEYALVGYRLRDTISAFGGVSRGICECDDAGYLTRVVEVTKVRARDDQYEGVAVDGTPHLLDGTELTSMNLWGFTPAVFPALAVQFESFLAVHGADPGAEFLISTALNGQVAADQARLRVLRSTERWFGMTFADDTPPVRTRIAELTASGHFPKHLSHGLP